MPIAVSVYCPVFRLDMYDSVFNERPVLFALSLAFRFLIPYTDVIDTDIAAPPGSVFNARCRCIIFELCHTIPSPVVFRDKVSSLLFRYNCRQVRIQSR